jgi:hypothetical protein
MKPAPEDEEDVIAAFLRAAYGGDANVELTNDGMNIWVYPAKGGSLHAYLSGVDSPVLRALLSVHRATGNASSSDSK